MTHVSRTAEERLRDLIDDLTCCSFGERYHIDQDACEVFAGKLSAILSAGSAQAPETPTLRTEVEAVAKFAASKARQFTDQAFGDSRVEDAANVLEDVALMLREQLAASSSDEQAEGQR